MKTTMFFPTLLAALALTACSNDETANENTTNDRVALQLTGGIQTRVSSNNWQKDDAIGIYMYKAGTTNISEAAENRKYTTAEGDNSFSADADNTIYFPVDGSEVDFYAYYPHQTAFNDKGQATFDVSDQTKQAQFDLMTAKLSSSESALIDKDHPNVALKFNHRMTLLELNIAAGTGIATSELQDLKVEITNQRTEGLFNPTTDEIEVNLTTGKTVKVLTAADGTFAQAILLPTTDADGFNPVITGRELIFTLASTGEVFRWFVPNSKLFKQGDRNIYNITINRSELNVTATIEDWNAGNGTGDNGSAE